jgi:hypothetical protein
MELVDIPVLGTGALRRVGSSPTEGNFYDKKFLFLITLLILLDSKILTMTTS